MAEISVRFPARDDRKGACGEHGEHGHRGHAGHDGATGATGPAGPPGATGPTGSAGTVGAAGSRGPTGPTGPTGATGATGPAGLTAALLPLSIHGSAFQASAHIGGAGVELQFGLNGAFIPARSGTVELFTSVSLPAGTRISTVRVRVTDSEGTPVEAHFGAEDGSLVKASELSRGDGTPQTLAIDVGGVLLASDTSYFIEAINPAGNLGWILHGATVS